jgi:mxaD protein
VTCVTLRLCTCLLAALPIAAIAHGPTPQRVIETIEIAAPPEKVWKVVGDFGGLAAWNPLVAKCAADKGSAADSERHVTLTNGAGLIDSMDLYDPAHMTYTYRLMNEDVQKFPVSFYSATITVKAAPSGSQVEWIGNFYRADTQNDPPENLNDDAAVKAMRNFFQSGLAGLKQALER